MICKKCGIEIDEEDIRVLKRGQYENKSLCAKCHKEEMHKLLPNMEE